MKTDATAKICENRFTLRTINANDAEILRIWKNEHKDFFFYKKEISAEEQLVWYKSLQEREEDYMFIVEDGQKPIGCIGSRLFNEFIDVYNVILGDKNYKGMHVMKNALWAVVAFSTLIFAGRPIRVQVLKTNPAIRWYEKIGFTTIEFSDDHVVMQLKNDSINVNYDFNINITLPKI